MTHGARTTQYIVISVVLSLLFHALVFTVFRSITMSTNFMATPETKDSRLLTFKEVEVEDHGKPKQTLSPKAPDIPPPVSLKRPPALAATTPRLADEFPGPPDIPPPKLPAAIPPPRLDAAPPPRLIQIDGDPLPEDKLKFNRLIIPKDARLDSPGARLVVAPDGKPVPSGLLLDADGGVDLRVSSPRPGLVSGNGPEQLPEKMPGTRLLPPEKVAILDELLLAKFYRYPETGGGGYFKVQLTPNPRATRLGTFKKDIIFLIDISGSISQGKLDEFVRGVKMAIKALSPNDRFEVVVFRDKPYMLFGKLSPPESANVKKALGFLAKLKRGGSTDIYSALAPYADKRVKTPGRPLLVFLVSDGQVNYGKIVDSRELINQISNANQDTVSILTFSCGQRMNSFLLDLLAYRNRGEFLKTSTIEGAGIELGNFINSVADIVVENPDYQVSSGLGEATFPKKLPNLYHNHPLSIYGKYFPDTESIGLRVVGFSPNGEKQEFIFNGKLEDAELASPELAQNWALQYIFHMYSALTAKYDDHIRETIHRVAAKYSLQLPFLDQHLIKHERYTE